MITQKQFDERVKKLYASQKKMASPRKWKSGRRAGTLRHPGFVVEFSEAQLRSALWTKVGVSALPCPYCRAPIDILNLTLDHVIPRSQDGASTLENMQACCEDCNHMKGEMSHEAFAMLLAFARRAFSSHDYSTLLKRLKAAHAGSSNRFFRDKKNGQPQGNALPPAAEQMQMEEDF